MAQQAQLQRTDTETVTETASLSVVKNIIRASVSQICYLRGLFEEKIFRDKPYAGLNIKTLHAVEKNETTGERVIIDPDAHLVTEWLERGVFPALQARYLHEVIFAGGTPPHTHHHTHKQTHSHTLMNLFDETNWS
jgi:hypothetical protein